MTRVSIVKFSFWLIVGLLCIGVFGLYGQEITRPWLHLPLNEGDLSAIKDISGNGVGVEVIHPDNFSWIDGPAGKVLHFGNAHQAPQRAALRCDMTNCADLSKGFTVAAMLKLPPELHQSRQYEIFFFADAHQVAPGVRVFFSWRAIRLLFHDGDNMTTVHTLPAKQSFLPNDWYHMAVTYDGDCAKIYVNGQLQTEHTGVKMAMPKVRKKHAHVGASTVTGAGYGFEGAISQFMLFDKPLPAPEIVNLYLQQ